LNQNTAFSPELVFSISALLLMKYVETFKRNAETSLKHERMLYFSYTVCSTVLTFKPMVTWLSRRKSISWFLSYISIHIHISSQYSKWPSKGYRDTSLAVYWTSSISHHSERRLWLL